MTDVHRLLATLAWKRSFHAKAKELASAIWKRRIVSLNDLTKVAHGIRGIRGLLEKPNKIPDIEDLHREAESFEKWLAKKWGPDDMGQHLGVHVETLGRAGALCVTWKGTLIDQELLSNGLSELRESESHGLTTTLLSHYRQVYQAVRHDGRVHPVYQRQNTYRLGSFWPNIQNFSTAGGKFASKRLVMAEEGKLLVGYDVKMAELFALAQRWADLYSGTPKARTLLEELNDGLDLHRKSGDILCGSSTQLKAEQVRQTGKIANFATLNLSRLDRINDNLQKQGLPRVPRKNYEALLKHLQSKYPLKEWHRDAGYDLKKRRVQTDYGRQIDVYRPQQFTGFQFQTPTGDAFGLGVMRLALAGYVPSLIIHDEAILELDDENQIDEANAVYLGGFHSVIPEANCKTKIAIYGNRWGTPSRLWQS